MWNGVTIMHPLPDKSGNSIPTPCNNSQLLGTTLPMPQNNDHPIWCPSLSSKWDANKYRINDSTRWGRDYYHNRDRPDRPKVTTEYKVDHNYIFRASMDGGFDGTYGSNKGASVEKIAQYPVSTDNPTRHKDYQYGRFLYFHVIR